MQLKTWTKGILTLFALLFLFAWAFQTGRLGPGGRRPLLGQPRLPVHDGPHTLHRAPAHGAIVHL